MDKSRVGCFIFLSLNKRSCCKAMSEKLNLSVTGALVLMDWSTSAVALETTRHRVGGTPSTTCRGHALELIPGGHAWVWKHSLLTPNVGDSSYAHWCKSAEWSGCIAYVRSLISHLSVTQSLTRLCDSLAGTIAVVHSSCPRKGRSLHHYARCLWRVVSHISGSCSGNHRQPFMRL